MKKTVRQKSLDVRVCDDYLIEIYSRQGIPIASLVLLRDQDSEKCYHLEYGRRYEDEEDDDE